MPAVVAPRRVAVLTGGGDVPGLNTVLKGLVWALEEAGCEVVGLRRGWRALVEIVPEPGVDNAEWVAPLTRAATRRIDRFGGTILHSSRLHPALARPQEVPAHLREGDFPRDPQGRYDLTAQALRVLDFLRLDAVVAIGGDGTLDFARRLDGEGVAVIAIPKTMDNDVYGTDYCVGFSTAVTRSVHYINDLRTAAGSHERFLVVELFGRYSGETCLLASYLAATDRALIAEVPFDPARLARLLLADKRANPSRYAVLAVSEGAYPVGGRPKESGAADAVGHRKLGGVGETVGEMLRQETGEGVIYQRLGYLMRSGPPDSLDQLVAKNYAGLAAELLLSGKTGQMVAVLGGRYTSVPVETLADGVKRVDVDRFYDQDAYRPRVTRVLGLPMFLH